MRGRRGCGALDILIVPSAREPNGEKQSPIIGSHGVFREWWTGRHSDEAQGEESTGEGQWI